MAKHSKPQKNDPTALQLTADEALFPFQERQLDGMVVSVCQNERPLSGLAGLLDWRLGGALSNFLKSGFLTGKVGECVYLPFQRHGQTTHLFLVGTGMSAAPGKRGPIPAETIHALKKNLLSLKLPRIGISRTDFLEVLEANEAVTSPLKGLSLWTVQ